MTITGVRLLSKSGGRHGDWRSAQDKPPQDTGDD